MNIDPRENGLLARLPVPVRALVLSDAAIVCCGVGPFSAPDRSLVFPLSGLLSVRARIDEARSSEVAMVGREGFVGSDLARDDGGAPFQVHSLVEGRAVLCDRDRLVRGGVAGALHEVTHLFQQTLLVQMAQGALAAVRSTVTGRLARWLLMVFDRLEGRVLHMTHDTLAESLGTRRPSITDATHRLEGLHAIRARRREIHLVSRDVLLGLAGGAYGLAEREYGRLLGDPAGGVAAALPPRPEAPPALVAVAG